MTNIQNILAIDTATESLGICLQSGEKRILNLTLKIGFQHSVFLVPWIHKLIDQSGIGLSQLDLLICSIGPGSFTGLRIGLSTAKGIAQGADCPVVGVPTLNAIAAGFTHYRGIIVPVIDARKNRFYSAIYEGSERITEYLDISQQDLINRCLDFESVHLTGPAANIIAEAMEKQSLKDAFALDPGYAMINPYFLLKAGIKKYFLDKKGNPDSMGPFYIRKSEAEIKQIEKT